MDTFCRLNINVYVPDGDLGRNNLKIDFSNLNLSYCTTGFNIRAIATPPRQCESGFVREESKLAILGFLCSVGLAEDVDNKRVRGIHYTHCGSILNSRMCPQF